MSYFIYVIGPKTPPVKIGITNNCEKRLMNLQTGNDEKLYVHHSEPVDRNLARVFEGIIHRQLNYKCTHGEWFDITPEEAINHIRFALIRYQDEPGLKHRFKQRLLTH